MLFTDSFARLQDNFKIIMSTGHVMLVILTYLMIILCGPILQTVTVLPMKSVHQQGSVFVAKIELEKVAFVSFVMELLVSTQVYNCYESDYKLYSEEKVQSVFMFSHKINNTGYIIDKLYT